MSFLKQSDLTDQALIKALPHPLYLVGRDCTVKQANPAAEELNGKLGIAGVLPNEVRRYLKEAVARNQAVTGDDIRQAVHLSNQAYLQQIFRLADAGDGHESWAVLLMEVTRLRQTVEAKARALSTLSHEVKTPLTGIRLSLHLLLEEKLGALNADQRELLEVGRDECERMLVTLQAQLELAHFENGRIELQLQPISPVELLAEAIASHGETVRSTGSELKTEISHGLPNVLADLRLTNRVLGNLVANAAKHGTKGRPVVLRAQPHGSGHVRLSVVNHGQPLSEPEQIEIFDQISRRPYGDSTGLGLALCREIIARHGGHMGVHCPAGSGFVEFFLDLRLAS